MINLTSPDYDTIIIMNLNAYKFQTVVWYSYSVWFFLFLKSLSFYVIMGNIHQEVASYYNISYEKSGLGNYLMFTLTL